MDYNFTLRQTMEMAVEKERELVVVCYNLEEA